MAKNTVELTPIQKKVLNLFSKSPLKNKFYWTGGTALAFLYLHHRQSKDLDFFSDKPFTYNQIIDFIKSLKKRLSLTKIETKKIFDRWEFFLHDKEELRIEFVFYNYPKVKPRKKWQGIFVDSLEDITTNKIMALFDRNDPKDLVDLYFILTARSYKMSALLKNVEKKFGLKLEEGIFWSEVNKSLKNLDEISPLLIAKTQKEKQKIIEKIKEYFISHSNNYLKRILK